MANVTSDIRLSQVPSDSPFVPGTNVQFAWDSTSLTTILSCPQRYKLGIIEGWTPKNPGVAIALAFGLAMHKGVELYHQFRLAGSDHDLAIEQVITEVTALEWYAQLPTHDDVQAKKEATDEDDDGIDLRNSKVRTRYHLVRALVWYFEQYKDEPMPVVRLADGTPAVEHSFRVPVGRTLSDGTDLLLSGHFDRLVLFNDRPYVVDLKSTKGITQQYRQGFDLSHQMTGYTLGGRLACAIPVKGVYIDAVALQVGGIKFSRFSTTRTDAQLDEYIDLLDYVGEMAERYFNDDYYPLNTAACMFCEYKDHCRVTPQLRKGILHTYFEQKPAWNPLANR